MIKDQPKEEEDEIVQNQLDNQGQNENFKDQ